MARKKPEKKQESTTEVREGFNRPNMAFAIGADGDKPSCFNGFVNVHRWRITVEMIDEPVEVIQGRIKELWETSNNSHHIGPLKTVATAYGLELSIGTFGCRRPRKCT